MIIRVLDEDGTFLSDDIVPWLVDPYKPLISQIEEGLLRLHWRSMKNRSVRKTTGSSSSSSAELAGGHNNGRDLSETGQHSGGHASYSQITIEAAARQLFAATARSPKLEGNEGGDTLSKNQNSEEGRKVDAVPSLDDFLSAFAFVIPSLEVSGRKRMPEVSFLSSPIAMSSHPDKEEDMVRVRMMEQFVFDRNGRVAPGDSGAHSATFIRGLAGRDEEGPVMQLRRRAFDTTRGNASGISSASQAWGEKPLIATHRRGSTAADHQVTTVNPYPFDSCQAFLERRRVLKLYLRELAATVARRCCGAPHTNVASFFSTALLPDVVGSRKHDVGGVLSSDIDHLALSLRHAVVEELTMGIAVGGSSGSATNTNNNTSASTAAAAAIGLNSSHLHHVAQNNGQQGNAIRQNTPIMGLVDDVALDVAEAPLTLTSTPPPPPIFVLDVTRTPYELGLRAGSALLLSSRSQLEAIAKAYYYYCHGDDNESNSVDSCSKELRNESNDYYDHDRLGLLTEKRSTNVRSDVDSHQYAAVVGRTEDDGDDEDGICVGDAIELGEETKDVDGIHDEGHERGGVHAHALGIQSGGERTANEAAAAAFATGHNIGLPVDVRDRHPRDGRISSRGGAYGVVFDGERKTELDFVHIIFSEDDAEEEVDPARFVFDRYRSNKSRTREEGTVMHKYDEHEHSSSSPHERGQSIVMADSVVHRNIHVDDHDDDGNKLNKYMSNYATDLTVHYDEESAPQNDIRAPNSSSSGHHNVKADSRCAGGELTAGVHADAPNARRRADGAKLRRSAKSEVEENDILAVLGLSPLEKKRKTSVPYDRDRRAARSAIRTHSDDYEDWSNSPSEERRRESPFFLRTKSPTIEEKEEADEEEETRTFDSPSSSSVPLFDPMTPSSPPPPPTLPSSYAHIRVVSTLQRSGEGNSTSSSKRGDPREDKRQSVGRSLSLSSEEEAQEALTDAAAVGLRKMAERGILGSASAPFFGNVEQQAQTAVDNRASQTRPKASNKHEDHVIDEEKRPSIALGRGGGTRGGGMPHTNTNGRTRQPLLSSPDTSSEDEEEGRERELHVHVKGGQRHEASGGMIDQRLQGGALAQSTRQRASSPAARVLSGTKRRVRFLDPFFSHTSTGATSRSHTDTLDRDDEDDSDIDDNNYSSYHATIDAINIDLSSYLPEEKRGTESRKYGDGRLQLYDDYASIKHLNNTNDMVNSKPVGVGSRPAAPRRDRHQQVQASNNYTTTTNGNDTDHFFGLPRHANETVIEVDDDDDDDEKAEQRATADVLGQRYASLFQESSDGAEEKGKLTASREERAATRGHTTKASSAKAPSPYQAALAAIAEAKQSAASFGSTASSTAANSSQQGRPTVSKTSSPNLRPIIGVRGSGGGVGSSRLSSSLPPVDNPVQKGGRPSSSLSSLRKGSVGKDLPEGNASAADSFWW